MSKKLKNKMQSIADILPSNLSEETVNKIALLVQEAIETEVNRKLDSLSTKVVALMRMKVDDFKETAKVELMEQDENYRNASLMETVKEIMALEVAPKHVTSLVETQLNEATEIMKESEMLESELEELLAENKSLKDSLRISTRNANKLDDELTKLKIILEHKKSDIQEARLTGKAKLKKTSVETELNEGRHNKIESISNDEMNEIISFSDFAKIAGLK